MPEDQQHYECAIVREGKKVVTTIAPAESEELAREMFAAAYPDAVKTLEEGGRKCQVIVTPCMPGYESHSRILREVSEERKYQHSKWENDFDDKNTLNDWVANVTHYLAQSSSMVSQPTQQRKHMLKVATLAIAALEAFDRNEGFPARHYEDLVSKAG